MVEKTDYWLSFRRYATILGQNHMIKINFSDLPGKATQSGLSGEYKQPSREFGS